MNRPEILAPAGSPAALEAAVACGEETDLAAYTQRLCKVKTQILPEPSLVRRYHQRYRAWKQLYPRLKGWSGE